MATQIQCRAIFREFSSPQIEIFLERCKNHSFQHVADFSIDQSVTYDEEPDPWDNRVETEVSFNINVDNKKLKYMKITEALSELTKLFEHLQHKQRQEGLSGTATVTTTLLTKNLYPAHFQLQHMFASNKMLFGSIVNRRFFAPTFLYYEPREGHDIFLQYMREQKDLDSDIAANMVTIFEHDREMLSILFPDIFRNKHLDGRPDSRVINLQLPYSAIRRLIVNLNYWKGEVQAGLTFQINYPPNILVNDFITEPYGDKRSSFKPSSRYLTWNAGLDIENSLSHASCIVMECHHIPPREFLDCIDRLRKNIDFPIEYRFIERFKSVNIKYYNPNFLNDYGNLPQQYAKLNSDTYYPLAYAVHALTSRGGEVYDYFFRPEFDNFPKFLDLAIKHYEDDLQREPEAKISQTVVVLELLLQHIDRLNDIPPLIEFFKSLYNTPGHQVIAELTDELEHLGYMRVRKLIITPTRKLFVNPELIMGNRFLRKHGSEQMIRILFRSDDGAKLAFLARKKVVVRCLEKALKEGVYVAGRQYVMVGSSCSQLRDNGCYFVHGTIADADDFRRSMGKFKIEPVPKMMARVGQCFTQSKLSRIRIDRKAYRKVPDYEGGANSQGKVYCFSDGVGTISASFAARISSDLHFIDAVPSCFQFRFRGFKGVLSVSPLLDKINTWLDRNGLDKDSVRLEMELRPSQEKFKGPREEFIEIVKHSAPSSVSLNKPMLNIMDQVSKKQSPETHKRIFSHVFYLLDRQLERIMGALSNENDALLMMAEFPKLVMYERLTYFCLTQEPFFRSLLQACAKSSLSKLTKKMRIGVPPSLGRSMFGIIDETGLLQSGQVFVRYTIDCFNKLPQARAEKRIYQGRVLVTKNPAIVSGDVRMFDAVDIPALRHLCDVIVFPRYGPRPHTDEMAGSDLDGDEYTVIWDPNLLFNHNEPAFDYSVGAQKPEDPKPVVDEGNFQNYMADFFIDYISQDSVGQLANAHLANSDLYGIDTEHCNKIAVKHNQSVDFPKTGIAPPRLRKGWEGDLPPERVERWPDFMGKKQRLCYQSRNLLGYLYRKVEDVEILFADSLTISEAKPACDPAFLLEDPKLSELAVLHFDFVESQYNQYSAQIQNLMSTYGIANEGELFSGHFSTLKGKLTQNGDNDDLSLFNTSGVVQHRLEGIFAKFRGQFFDYFPEGRSYLEVNERTRTAFQPTSVVSQLCTHPSEAMSNVARLYYMYAYALAPTQFLSFPWLVWDILTYIKQNYVLKNGFSTDTTHRPLPHESTASSKIIESSPFTIEVASDVPLRECLSALEARAKEVGCAYLSTRVLSKFPGSTIKICLVARGTLLQIKQFQDSIAVMPGDFASARELYTDMVRQASEKLFSPLDDGIVNNNNNSNNVFNEL